MLFLEDQLKRHNSLCLMIARMTRPQGRMHDPIQHLTEWKNLYFEFFDNMTCSVFVFKALDIVKKKNPHKFMQRVEPPE